MLFELFCLFVGLPVLYLFDFAPGLWKGVPLLLLFLYCLITLHKADAWKRSDWSLRTSGRSDWLKLLIFPVLLYSSLLIVSPDAIWADYSDKGVVIAIISYPLFSSLPQEIIYRKFFYLRYSGLVANPVILVAINALLFSFAHIYFANYVALLLTFLGGIAFSISYRKSKSLLFVSIEHSVYGLALLCSSMNQYFYKAF